MLLFPLVVSAEKPDAVWELENLDRQLARRDEYISMRRHKIDSLQKVRSRQTVELQKLISIEKIGDAFGAFNNDSTLFYYNLGLHRAVSNQNDSMSVVFQLKIATYLPLSGFVNEAIIRFENVDTTAITAPLRRLYLESARQMYSYISSYYKSSPDMGDYYQEKSLGYQKMIVDEAGFAPDVYSLNLGEYYYMTRHYNEAEQILKALLEKLPSSSNMYARACHILSSIAAVRGDNVSRLAYLAKSAASDIESATLEVVSLQELGNYLYNSGDVIRSYKYLQNALENAVQCNAQLRMVEVSAALPIIEQAHSERVTNQKKMMTILIICMGVLLLALGVILVYIYRERNHIAILKLNLEQANRTKDVYLGQFMNMCSTYMEKLISFNKVVNRKLSAGKTEDLYKITKSGKFVEEQAREFYHAFDEAFLHIYPDFVSEVNNLLLPGERISIEDGEKMNTNLRILAFMRLGMDDATKMAQILNYSVNTIYAYRNRLKNRAINRDTFEEDVMKIRGI